MNLADRKKRITVIVFLFTTMALLGVIASMRSTMQPVIKAEFGASYTQQSIFMFAGSAIGIVASTMASFSIQKKGAKTTMLMGFLLMALSTCAYYFSPGFSFVIVMSMVFRLGFSSYEIGANPIFSMVFVTKIAAMMSLYHCCYGLGSTVGPLVYRFMSTSMGMDWRKIHLIISILNMLCFAALLFLKVPTQKMQAQSEQEQTEQEEKPSLTIGTAYKNKTIIILGICLGFVGLYEMSPVSWGVFYLQDVAGFDPTTTTATFLSVFYAFFTLSRMFLGGIMEKFGYVKSLTGCLLTSVFLHAIAFVFGGNAVWLIAVSGLSMGLLWPSMMALCVRIYGVNSGVASGVMMTICPLVTSVCQLLIGQVNTNFGIGIGYMFMSVFALLGILSLAVLKSNMKKENLEIR